MIYYTIARVRGLDKIRDDYIDGSTKFPDLHLSSMHPEDLLRRLMENDNLDTLDLDKQLLVATMSGDVESYRQASAELYGEPDVVNLSRILGYLEIRSEQTKTSSNYEYIREAIDGSVKTGQHFDPPKSVYRHYSTAYQSGFREELEIIKRSVSKNRYYDGAVEDSARSLGLLKNGWQVKTAVRGNGLFIVGRKKTIYTPKKRRITDEFRTAQVIAHELLVHVVRRQAGIAYSPEEEAIGVLVEQLMSKRYIPKRMIRFFAVAVAWGVDGKRRDFNETFDLVHNAVLIVGRHGGRTAKEVAFNETARAFRGADTTIPGCVITKDSVYFVEMIKLWQQLRKERLDQDQLKKFIQGVGNEQ